MLDWIAVTLGMPVWSAAAALALAVAATVTDLLGGKVPNWLTYPAIVLAVGVHLLLGGWAGRGGNPGLAWSLAGFGAGFGVLGLCWLLGGVGGGDVKLMGAMGGLGGLSFAIATMLYGSVVGFVMAVVVIIHKRKVRRTLRRIFNAVILLVTPGAKPADPTSQDSPRIPFAVALCCGAVAVGAVKLLWAAGG